MYRKLILHKLFSGCLLITVLSMQYAMAANENISELIRSRIEQLNDSHELYIGTDKVIGVRVIQEFYTRRNFQPAWVEERKIKELLEIIRNISDDGLSPEDYSLSTLVYLDKLNKKSIGQQVDLDILLTDSLLRLGFQIRFGKVDPNSLDSNWNLTRDLEGKDPAVVLQAAIEADSLQVFIDTTLNRQPFYRRFKAALAKYRSIKANGGWPEIPEGPTLKPGMDDRRVVALRKRLLATGDLNNDKSNIESLFDDKLTQAVMAFQVRHGLEADGLVGQQTLQTMNISIDERIDQIRVNIERGRWVLKDLTDDFVLVNIAAFRAFLVRDDNIVWDTKVMVGKTYRKSPIFKASMKYLVFNPTWTIPPGIMRRDILPKSRKDPEYVRSKGYVVLDRDGKPVDYDNIDWVNATPRNFPYIVRQPAGPNNALGEVKFIFPNSHFVFLHDTNHRELFVKPERAFSSGCIRVENPFELAELILNDSNKWNQQRFSEIVQSGKTQTVHLDEPLPVLLLYWTIVVNPDGTVSFLKDVYDRDTNILTALDSQFVVSPPEGTPDIYLTP